MLPGSLSKLQLNENSLELRECKKKEHKTFMDAPCAHPLWGAIDESRYLECRGAIYYVMKRMQETEMEMEM